MTFDEFLSRLSDHGLKRSGAGYVAKCPGHGDRQQSLSINRGSDGKVLLKCFTGCTARQVVEAMGLELSDLFAEERKKAESAIPKHQWPVTATYVYRDEAGAPLYRVLRKTSHDTGDKTFVQQRANGSSWVDGLGDVRRVLYRLPELLAADPTAPVFNVEGEKDVDNLAAIGIIATTNACGASSWKGELFAEAHRGRRVFVIPDNDKAGEARAKSVAESLRGVAASVTILRIPGLGPKGDVSDWLYTGGTAERLLAMAAKAGPVERFIASPERLNGEREERLADGPRMLEFGVQYFDDAMAGIAPYDLILVGAPSGVGKTEFATGIALHNCALGKRAHYFALEAEDREIERRIKFRLLSDMFHEQRRRGNLRYIDWRIGRADHLVADLEPVADMELRRITRNLRTFYRVRSFGSADFLRHLDEIREETDVVVLDHFHVMDNEDDNETRGHKKAIQAIHDAALEAGKPVVVVAHLRKKDRKSAPLVPELDDFHGASDIAKMATKAITLAPAYELPGAKPHLWNTYARIAKCRQESAVTRYAALLVFDSHRNSYEREYTIGRLSDGGTTFSDLSYEDTPHWARKKESRTSSIPLPNDSYYDPREDDDPFAH